MKWYAALDLKLLKRQPMPRRIAVVANHDMDDHRPAADR